MTTARYDLPTPDDASRPWWDATAEGRLWLSAVPNAAKPTTTRGPSAPDAVESRFMGGGEWGCDSLHLVRRPPERPSSLRTEGPLCRSSRRPRRRSPDDDEHGWMRFAELRVGMRLHVDFEDIGEGFNIPVFRPA